MLRHADLGLKHLLPGHCAFCLALPMSGQPWCDECFRALPWNHHACHQCAEPFSGDAYSLCGHCLKQPPAYDSARVGLRYEGEVALLIQRFKFNADPRAGALLVDLMHAGLQRLLPHELPQALIAVPRHPLRAREFGFDQALWITQHLARRLEIHCLVARRARRTPTQRGLDRSARLRNVQDAFAIDVALPAHVAVVDDIMTTGASLDGLAKACSIAGASRVEAWAAARTPLTSS
nr:ComF family protein [Halomonas sp. M20]